MECLEFLKTLFPMDNELIQKLEQRVQKGIETYGKPLSIGDVPFSYLDEELLDSLMYLVNHFNLKECKYSYYNSLILKYIMDIYNIRKALCELMKEENHAPDYPSSFVCIKSNVFPFGFPMRHSFLMVFSEVMG